jgi:autoinducer 2 (AI-2) kinase
VASVGLGLFANFAEASDELVRWERDVEPNPVHRSTYDEAKARWQTAYAVQKSLVDRKITTALWSAPGALGD